jgi:hypothetical protein
VVERLNEFTTALEHTTALSIERFEITAETAVTTAISRLSLAASQLELERQGRVSLGSRSSSGVSSASPSKLVDQRPAAGDQERLDELEWEHQKKGEEMWQARRLIKDLRSQVKKSADKAAAVTARAAAEARSFALYYARAASAHPPSAASAHHPSPASAHHLSAASAHHLSAASAHCKTVDKDKELLQAHRLIKDLQRQVRKSAAEAEAVTARAAAEARLFALNYA